MVAQLAISSPTATRLCSKDQKMLNLQLPSKPESNFTSHPIPKASHRLFGVNDPVQICLHQISDLKLHKYLTQDL
jgi:hypothetical protein